MTITLKDVGSGFKRTAINENFDTIESELNNNVLRRDGVDGANQLEVDIDMNSQRLLNLVDAINGREPVTLDQLNGALSAASSGLIAAQQEQQTGAQVVGGVTTFTGITYTVSSNNLYVFRNGNYQTKGVDYNETSTSSITWTTVPNATDALVFITNLATTNSVADTAAISHTQSGTNYNLATYLQNRHVVSVNDYSDLVVGDDWGAAIQAAVDYAESLGGAQLWFTGGDYKTTKTIDVLLGNISIKGGFSRIVNEIPLADGVAAASVFYIQASNVSIENLRIKNTPGVNWDTYVDLGHLGATICITPMDKGDTNTPVAVPIENIKVDQIHIEDSVNGRFVTSVRGRVYNCEISNITVEANGTITRCYKVGSSVEHTGQDYQPRNTTIRNTSWNGFEQVGSAGQFGFFLSGPINCVVENSYMDNVVDVGCYMFTGDQTPGPTTLGGVSITVKNLRFFNCKGDTFLIAGNAQPNPDQAKTQFIVENCYVDGDVADLGATGIRCISTLGSLRIANTLIENIAVGADFTDSSEVELDQLTFNNIIENGTNTRAGKALIIERCDGFDVSNCGFDACEEEAIWISESNGNTIRGNTFKDVYTVGSASSDQPAVTIRNGSSNNTLRDNTFGYESIASPPWRWIALESAGGLGTGIDQYNKIVDNTFYDAGGTQPILNGVSASTYVLFTIIQNNTIDTSVTNRQLIPSASASPISFNGNNYVVYGVTAAPTVGTWIVGDRAERVPAVGQPKGWVCTVAGTPGTWVSEGNL